MYQRQLGLRPEIRLWTAIVVSVSFLAHVPYTDMGQPIEGLLVAGGIAFGELLGLTLEAQRPARRPESSPRTVVAATPSTQSRESLRVATASLLAGALLILFPFLC